MVQILENMHHASHKVNFPKSLLLHSLTCKRKRSLIHKRGEVTHVLMLRVLIPMFLPAIEPDDLSKKRTKTPTNPTVTSLVSCWLTTCHRVDSQNIPQGHRAFTMNWQPEGLFGGTQHMAIVKGHSTILSYFTNQNQSVPPNSGETTVIFGISEVSALNMKDSGEISCGSCMHKTLLPQRPAFLPRKEFISLWMTSEA